MANQIQDVKYKKSSVIAQVGQSVTPAIYLIRSGSLQLTQDKETKTLQSGESFAFGQDALALTSASKQQNFSDDAGFAARVANAAKYLGDMTLKAKGVVAQQQVVVTEDATLGRLTLTSMANVLYDITRLGAKATTLNKSITVDSLEKHRILGAGTLGQEWLTSFKKETDQTYALKVQNKRELIDYGQAKGVIREKKVMERMNHPFVMSLVNAEQDEIRLYMVMNLIQGGELSSLMYHLDEKGARFYSAGILEGLSYMHRRHFIYRDLKGQNVLLDKDGYCVIVDLGFGALRDLVARERLGTNTFSHICACSELTAKFVPDKTWTFCGTPLYASKPKQPVFNSPSP